MFDSRGVVILRDALLLLTIPLMLGALAGARRVPRTPARSTDQGLVARFRARLQARPPLQGGAPLVLASDAERERVAGLIARAVGEGQLGVDEGTDRIEAIWRARHQRDLTELVSDLPLAPEPNRRKVGVGSALAVLVSLGATAVQGVLGLWELWPAAVGVCALIAFGSRRSPGR